MVRTQLKRRRSATDKSGSRRHARGRRSLKGSPSRPRHEQRGRSPSPSEVDSDRESRSGEQWSSSSGEEIGRRESTGYRNVRRRASSLSLRGDAVERGYHPYPAPSGAYVYHHSPPPPGYYPFGPGDPPHGASAAYPTSYPEAAYGRPGEGGRGEWEGHYRLDRRRRRSSASENRRDRRSSDHDDRAGGSSPRDSHRDGNNGGGGGELRGEGDGRDDGDARLTAAPAGTAAAASVDLGATKEATKGKGSGADIETDSEESAAGQRKGAVSRARSSRGEGERRERSKEEPRRGVEGEEGRGGGGHGGAVLRESKRRQHVESGRYNVSQTGFWYPVEAAGSVVDPRFPRLPSTTPIGPGGYPPASPYLMPPHPRGQYREPYHSPPMQYAESAGWTRRSHSYPAPVPPHLHPHPGLRSHERGHLTRKRQTRSPARERLSVGDYIGGAGAGTSSVELGSSLPRKGHGSHLRSCSQSRSRSRSLESV